MNSRMLTLEQKRYFVGLLELVCEKLELPASLYQKAVASYEAVGNWLGESELQVLAQSSIYPQGSMRIRTTVRPVGSDEFDVDLVCHLPVKSEAPPGQVRKVVGDRLADNATYKEMLQDLNRGWRLNYAGEFHMDITPAIDDPSHNSGGVLVPDRKLQAWSESNPEGYASWFDEIAETGTRLLGFEAIAINEDLKPLPDQIQFKGALRRIVQILKRHRDVYFLRPGTPNADDKPISIVLTTLAAHAFRDQTMRKTYDNELDLLIDVVALMPDYIEPVLVALDHKEWWVLNPTNVAENFAEKWHEHPARMEAFFTWHRDIQSELQNLFSTAGTGLDSVEAMLSQLLGERESRQVINECADRLNALRDTKSVQVGTTGLLGVGTSTTSSRKVPKNTFYGN